MPTLQGGAAGAIRLAAERLAAGDLVAFPTETVYGLGARADSDAAVARIFAAKGRPLEHPLIVHVADAAAAAGFAAALPPMALALIAGFWPGPLTLVVERRPGVGAAAAGGLPTIALRCPDHPVAQALLRAAGRLGVAGVAAPSANRFGRVSPTLARHVVEEFGPTLTVLDGGACREGIESTIVDCTRDQPYVLRPGTLDRAALEATLGCPLRARDAVSPRVSGAGESHYAPAAKVHLVDARALVAGVARAMCGQDPRQVGIYARHRPENAAVARFRPMPDNAADVAHELFAVLRQFDADGVSQIWVEAPPETPEWDGVRDRLQRAAAA